MDVPYITVGIPVQAIVIIVPALIGTEFLVGSSPQDITAVETNFFHNT